MSLQDQLRILKNGLTGADHRLLHLFSSSDVGVCLIGRDGRFECLNPAWESCLGHPVADMLGKAFLDFVYPDDRMPTESATERLRRETTVRFRNRFRQSDGNYRTLQWVASRVDRTGAICAVVRAPAGSGEAPVVKPPVEDPLEMAGLGASLAELYRRVVETSPDAIIVTDLSGTVLMCNQQAAIQQGRERAADLLGLNAFDFVAPEQRDLAAQNARRTLEEGLIRAVEYVVLRRDGTRAPAELSASVIRGPDGEPRAFVAVVRDISGRKRAQSALLESQERYRSIVETSPDAIFLTGIDRRIVICNQVAADLLGYESMEEMLGMDALELVAPEGRDAAIAETQEAFQTGSLRNARYILLRKDGSTFPGEISASVIRDAAGSAAGFTAIVRDITEREQTQEALRASEERFRVLYRDNPSMFFTVDPAGTVLSVNEFGATQLGYSPEELVGQPVLDVFYEEDKAEVVQQLAACVASPGEMRNWEFRKVRKDGRVIWVKEAARATLGPAGETMVLIVCEDISDRRRMEAELERAREELERKVEQQMRTRAAYGLTFRELTVLHLVAAGCSDKEIATNLGISPLTVSKHVANITTKMGAQSRSEATARAVRDSLLE